VRKTWEIKSRVFLRFIDEGRLVTGKRECMRMLLVVLSFNHYFMTLNVLICRLYKVAA
jgi:hypothetical protein